MTAAQFLMIYGALWYIIGSGHSVGWDRSAAYAISAATTLVGVLMFAGVKFK